MADTDRKTAISRFLRRATEVLWPFGALQNTNDPHKAIENLERASAAATLWILLGILLDIGALVVFAHDWPERAIGILANAAIGFGLIAEYLLIGKVIDATAEAERESNERIAKIGEKAAEANARASEAQLALEKYKAPRRIDGPDFLKRLEGKPKAPVEILFVRDDFEGWQLALQIRDWLKAANWEHSQPAAITGPDDARLISHPSAMQVGGQPKGVAVVQRVTSQADFEREKGDVFLGPFDTPGKALSNALMGSLGELAGLLSFSTGPAPGTLRVVVGPKP